MVTLFTSLKLLIPISHASERSLGVDNWYVNRLKTVGNNIYFVPIALKYWSTIPR
jgi:hypothetical protein